MDKYGLIGRKLSHSYSKIIHEEIYRMLGINATYDLIEVEEFELKTLIDKLRNGEYKGFNVTIPYKEKILEYVDYVDDAVKNIKAANTIYIKDGKVCATNTDYLGFIEELKFFNIGLTNRTGLILGSGGASKAVAYALDMIKAKYHIVSRTKRLDNITYSELDNVKYSYIINTTPVGMYPNVDSSPLDEKYAAKASVIIDLIYNPKNTKLMGYNQNSYNGLMMLLNQAIKAEEKWQGEILNLDIDQLLEKIKEVIYCV